MPGSFKISSHQLMILILLYSVGTVILHTPSPLAGFAKQDAWLAALFGTGIALIFVWFYIRVGNLYPDLALDQINEKVFGKLVGKMINLTFFFWSFSTAAETTYYVGNFIKTFWMPDTPLVALNILLAAVVIFTVHLGIETFTRTLEIFFIPVLLLLTIFLVSIIPQANIHNIQPVFEGGANPLIRAILFYVSVFTLSPVMFLMIFPSKVNERKKGEKAFYIGTLIGGIILILVIMMNILVLGPDNTARNIAPSYTMAKKINVGNFLMRIEAVIATIWIFTTYTRTVMYFYVSVVVFSNIFNIKDYRPFTTALGMIMVCYSLIVFPTVSSSGEYNKHIWLFHVAAFGLVLPLLLFITAKFRNIIKKPPGRQQ
ncbi:MULTISPECIES: endospore germination permease [unclassified Bacillus (in: firmicutes)]|uniref:GerAB/ArcD/ProY family transporter n=1 Tax=unclassified Bacillus (in: firmicutes) TaxID=185979 RepID=UPI001BED02F4|nr:MULTISPECIES: endospore germination permease [unclassified Bacillus (in: firmicutes)]MBT2618388.1 endospore germination permease [Bacillus sp. ISL-78]MBT2629910.1 endospore germination permease [Bacillus sp. ISL-101]